MENFKKHIGSKIVEARNASGISQRQLAQKLNVTQQCLSLYERGEHTISLFLVVKISEALNTPLEYFVPRSTNGDILSPSDVDFISEIRKLPNPDLLLQFLKSCNSKVMSQKNIALRSKISEIEVKE